MPAKLYGKCVITSKLQQESVCKITYFLKTGKEVRNTGKIHTKFYSSILVIVEKNKEFTELTKTFKNV